MFFFSFLHSGGWGYENPKYVIIYDYYIINYYYLWKPRYGPRYGELSEMIRKNVPSAEIEGHVGRRSTNVLFALFS